MTSAGWCDFLGARIARRRSRPLALGRWVFEPMLAAIVLIGGYRGYLVVESPGTVIRRDLIRAGAEVAELRWSTPRELVRQSASRHFVGYRASVDAANFPAYVRVTLKDLDRETCHEAYRAARRIEGRVVIEIEGPGELACKDGAALTWRIMP